MPDGITVPSDFRKAFWMIRHLCRIISVALQIRNKSSGCAAKMRWGSNSYFFVGHNDECLPSNDFDESNQFKIWQFKKPVRLHDWDTNVCSSPGRSWAILTALCFCLTSYSKNWIIHNWLIPFVWGMLVHAGTVRQSFWSENNHFCVRMSDKEAVMFIP